MLFAFSDSGLLLTIVGLYAAFVGLWFCHWLFEGNAAGAIAKRRKDKRRDNSVREIERNRKRRARRESQPSNSTRVDVVPETKDAPKTVAVDDEKVRLRRELAELREEKLAIVRELELAHEEAKALRAQLQSHRPPHEDSEPQTLRLFDPADEVQPAAAAVDTCAQPDDLTRIWGIGEVNQVRLQQEGIYYFEQIAAWDAATVQNFNDLLAFKGRIEREGWVNQAQRLATAKQRRRAA